MSCNSFHYLILSPLPRSNIGLLNMFIKNSFATVKLEWTITAITSGHVILGVQRLRITWCCVRSSEIFEWSPHWSAYWTVLLATFSLYFWSITTIELNSPFCKDVQGNLTFIKTGQQKSVQQWKNQGDAIFGDTAWRHQIKPVRDEYRMLRADAS